MGRSFHLIISPNINHTLLSPLTLAPMAFRISTSTTPHSALLRFGYLNRLSQNSHPPQLCVKKGNTDSGDKLVIENNDPKNGNVVSIWEEIEYVEAIAIGSRKDAVLDFCLNSPSLSPALRFWNILVEDSSKMQLQQRLPSRDVAARIVEAPSELKSYSKAVILVAGAAYGSDDISALKILQTIKSANGLVIGLILKPFSFEGKRRQDEVKCLVDKLQMHANFCIAVDTDRLLEKDTVTLDEALKTSNNAILMAINAISVIISEKHKKIVEVPEKGIMELNAPEIRKILESYTEARIGFGAGFNIKTSVSRAVYDCPFLGRSVKDCNGRIVCILASSGTINNNDADSILHTVRRITECKTSIVLSIIHDPNLECNLVVTTIVTFGFAELSSQKNSIFSRLADRFPFIFSILKHQYPQTSNDKENYVSETSQFSEVSIDQNDGEVPDETSLDPDDTSEALGIYTKVVNVDEVLSSLRNNENSSEDIAAEFSDYDSYPLEYMPNVKGVATFEKEMLTRYRLGPDNHKMEEWAKEGNANASLPIDSVNFYTVPVGVKDLEQLNDYPVYPKHQNKLRTENYTKPNVTPNMPWNGVRDQVVEASVDFNSISSSKGGSYAGDSIKQRVLSVRAASMLEAERDSDKKWSPLVEMKYRGGIYRGRIQGGLPEGKGCLSLEDGSKYDGMWRYGKRSGLGTFYFRNGDVFQGSWRDDAMHGKGWFYFYTGDRWFTNFWKGKANGEGRFYSKLGDVFFGHFKNGWRHGHFLCISVDGTRFREVWEEGILVSRGELDSNADATS